MSNSTTVCAPLQASIVEWLVAPGDPRTLADAVCKLLADPPARQEQGAANRRHACDTLALDVVAERMRDIYAQCLDV